MTTESRDFPFAMASSSNNQNDKPSTSTTMTDKLKKIQEQMAKYKTQQRQPYSIDDKNDFPPLYLRRINNDFNQFLTDPTADIFLVPESSNILCAHAIIIGPSETPYEGGFYYFYMKLPYDYPLHPPKVKLMTTAQNTVRFNPNFYSNGKVCLSILGTWPGPGWSAGGTILSALVSIHSLMTDKPYHNEPGFEENSARYVSNKSRNDPVMQYNDIIRHENIRVAVIGMLEDSDDCRNMPVFLKEKIIEQFKSKIAHYDKVIDDNMSLDGKPMEDPFKDPRGVFQYKMLRLKLDQLKQKFS